VPPGYVCIANGVLTEQSVLDSRRVLALEKVGNPIYHFETKFPVKYLSVLFGRLDRLPAPSKPSSVPVEAYASPDIGSSRLWVVEEIPAILARFESWFGPFPYEKLSVIQRLHPTAGGHSPASFVVLNEVPRSPDILPPQPVSSPVDLSRWREYFLAHEIAHQWWGQAVAGERYHDQWLSEGLAQFAAVSYLRAKFGEDAYAGIIKRFSQWTERTSRFGAVTLGSRLSYLDFEAYQALVYDKSAVALAMLRDLLGEDVFFKGLRTFIATYKYKLTRTANFIKIMETVSGRDLKTFFNGWFDSYLLPEVRVASAVQAQGGEHVLRFRITQTRGVFVFPLRVTWEENGRGVRKMLEVNAAAQEFEFRTAGRPRRIRINPDKAVPGEFRDGG
jgi:aminopeptidase N